MTPESNPNNLLQLIEDQENLRKLFFDNVTHELKTPLTLILLPLEELIEKCKDSEDLSTLQNMKKNALHLQNLINQLLDVSKLEHGKLELLNDIMTIEELADNIISNFEPIAKHHEVTITYELENQKKYFISFHDKIKTVLDNLVGNAIKYNKPKGNVHIKMQLNEKQSTLLIEVHDTGIGIVPENQDKVFERFYKVDIKMTSKGGTGIGLSMVKDFINFLNGSIQLKSEPNKGSVFYVEIPVQIKSENASVSIENNQLSKILIVEDNIELMHFLKKMLQNNFVIIEAENGKTGLEAALEHVPELILSDLMMPIMNGYEMIQAIKNDDRISHIPVLVLSAKTGVDSKLNALSIGADDFISKPFNKDELILKIKNRLNNMQLLWKKLSHNFQGTVEQNNGDSKELSILLRLKKIVTDNINNPQFGVEQFCEIAKMSRTQLHNKLKILSNLSTTEFINLQRLEKSKELLQTGQYNISEVSEMVGYNSLSYFSRKFLEYFNITPIDFKNK